MGGASAEGRAGRGEAARLETAPGQDQEAS